MKDIRRLTLEERVGQLFFVGFQGSAPDPESSERLARIRPGGLVFLQRNIDSIDQIYDLNLRFQAQATVPFFLAINQEGGAVDRLKHVIAPIPSVADLADLGTAAVRAGARLIASELEACGFNLNLSPVLDLGLPASIVRERTLAAASAEVGRLGRVVIDEFEKKSILSCGRHFPGLGGARRDPHFLLPRVGRTRRELIAEDVVPFNEVQSGLDMVLVSHGHYPALGDIRPVPASLSHRVVDGLLRETMGFEGISVTDDLTMGAVTASGLTPKTFLKAIQAGNDMVMFSQLTPLLDQAFELVVESARSDLDLRKRIDQSVERILHAKRKLEFAPIRNRPHAKARLTRQIEKLKQSIPTVEKVHVR
jgi:beta-N-acetylhexosaminidase